MESGTNKVLFNVLKDFATISLDQLNATMSLMERVEKKYLVSLTNLEELMKKLYDDYYILSINNNSIFTYDNIYMDTDDFLFYNQHKKGETSRMKVRTREYVDSDLAFFECKEKAGEVIRKSRYSIPVKGSKQITNENKAFFRGICSSLSLDYGDIDLHSTIRTNYKRITLCSKQSDERITIDFDIQIQDLLKDGSETIGFGPVAIIETKSSHQKTRGRRIIKKLGYEEADGCSKYCIGVILGGHDKSSKKFKSTIEFIEHANKDTKKLNKKTSQQLETMKGGIINEIKEKSLAHAE